MTAKDFFEVPIKVGDEVLMMLQSNFQVGTITKIEEDWWSKDRHEITISRDNITFNRSSRDVAAISSIQKEYPENFI